MSDPEEEKAGTIPLSAPGAEELGALMQSISPDFKCVVCGQDHFEVASAPSTGVHSRIEIFKDKSPLPTHFIPTVTTTCMNCGHIHAFSLRYLLAHRETK